MTKEAIIVGLAALAAIAFFAFNSISNEYARIQSRFETTQAKVDALADELQATTKTVHAAIKSLTDRFLAGDAVEAEMVETIKEIDVANKLLDSLTLSKPTQPKIIMHSGHSCGPCNAWIARDMPRWIQSGWTVEVVKELDTGRSWPWYEITDRDGSQFQVDGPLNNTNFNASKAGAK